MTWKEPNIVSINVSKDIEMRRIPKDLHYYLPEFIFFHISCGPRQSGPTKPTWLDNEGVCVSCGSNFRVEMSKVDKLKDLLRLSS